MAPLVRHAAAAARRSTTSSRSSTTPATRPLPPEVRPRTECLADVVARMLPYWYDAIVPDLRARRAGARRRPRQQPAGADQAPRRDERGRGRRAQRPDRHPAALRPRRRPAPAARSAATYLDPDAAAAAIEAVKNQGQQQYAAPLRRWSRASPGRAYSARAYGEQEGIRRPPEERAAVRCMHPQGARAHRPVRRRDQDDRGHHARRPGPDRARGVRRRRRHGRPSSATGARSPRSARAPSSASCRCSTTARAPPAPSARPTARCSSSRSATSSPCSTRCRRSPTSCSPPSPAASASSTAPTTASRHPRTRAAGVPRCGPGPHAVLG